ALQGSCPPSVPSKTAEVVLTSSLPLGAVKLSPASSFNCVFHADETDTHKSPALTDADIACSSGGGPFQNKRASWTDGRHGIAFSEGIDLNGAGCRGARLHKTMSLCFAGDLPT